MLGRVETKKGKDTEEKITIQLKEINHKVVVN